MRSTGRAGGLRRRSRTGRIALSALQGVHQSICGHVSALQGVPHQQYPEYHPCNFNPHSRSSDIQVPLAKQIHNRTRAKVPLTTEIPPIRRAYRRIGSENPDRGVPRRFQECGRVPNLYQTSTKTAFAGKQKSAGPQGFQRFSWQSPVVPPERVELSLSD